ncbi:MAG: PAS domain-containing protein [Acidobacteriota bacterium]
MIDKAAEVRGVLAAYQTIVNGAWDDLHPEMAGGAERWRRASVDALTHELEGYLGRAAEPPREIRVFWKLSDQLTYSGCNLPFARDAGFQSTSEMVGVTDFCETIPWTRQAAKYQADDREVMASGAPKLFILERQAREDGVFWLFTSKAPIRVDGAVVGILGLYETIDGARAMEIRRRMEREGL